MHGAFSGELKCIGTEHAPSCTRVPKGLWRTNTLLNRMLKAPFPFLWWCTNFNFPYFSVVSKQWNFTEWGGSVVTHETRIREVPGSNPGADQPGWGFFVVFFSHQGKFWVGFSLPRSIWPLFTKFIYHKIIISELNKWNIDNTTIEIYSLLIYTQRP